MGLGPQGGGSFPGPFLVGFERTRTLMERAARGEADGYPPFNIEEFENGFRIVIAVAGFSPDELDTTLDGRELVVSGAKAEIPDRVFLHRGIATRRFRRAFALGEGIEVRGAAYAHGLLSIDLEVVAPETRIRRIPITVNGQDARTAPKTVTETIAKSRRTEAAE
jgi:HSP20 family molecular chaperone IbpA